MAEQKVDPDSLTTDSPLVILSSSARVSDVSGAVARIAKMKLRENSEHGVVLALVFDPLTPAEVRELFGEGWEGADIRFQDVWRAYVLVERGSRGYLLRSLDSSYLEERISAMLEDVIADD